MTAAQEQTFLQLVTLTLYPAEAARHVDLSPQAISMRRKRDKAFDDRVKGAESKAMFALIARVQEGAKRDWRAALALLERRWPELWSRPEIRNATENAKLAEILARTEEIRARTKLVEKGLDHDATAGDLDKVRMLVESIMAMRPGSRDATTAKDADDAAP